MAKKKYVTASDIGRVAYCPRSVSLEKQGHAVSADAQLRRQRGNIAHQHYNKQVRANQDKRCFIATATFGEYHPVTQAFRDYRDRHLTTRTGRCFVHVYYAVSPTVCRLLERYPSLIRPVKSILLFIHQHWVRTR